MTPGKKAANSHAFWPPLYLHLIYSHFHFLNNFFTAGLLSELVNITMLAIRNAATISDHADLIDCFYAMLGQVSHSECFLINELINLINLYHARS